MARETSSIPSVIRPTVPSRPPSASPQPAEALDVERRAAEACRMYHARASQKAERRRSDLAEFALAWYEDRLRVPVTTGQRATIDALADADALVLEVAHDGQLPHLGVVRMVLKAHDIARLDGRGVALYLVGNHYTPAMRPDNVHFGMPLRGSPPHAVKHPPKVRIGKANAHRPFRWLPPPRSEDLADLQAQLAQFVDHNIAHERKAGTLVPEEVRTSVRLRLKDCFALLDSAARDVGSFGDWLIRVQHDVFHRMLGTDSDHILFLPMAELTEMFREDLAAVARATTLVRSIKESVSAEQAANGEEPYLTGGEPSPFWIHCPRCLRRQRATWTPGTPIPISCPQCGHRQVMAESDAWAWMVPDIVAYEAGLFRLGIDGWVVGSHAAYHPVIERVYREVFGGEMPPKFFLTSVPTFRGLGEPPEGYPRTRLLRALLEMEPSAVAKALRAPWDENPHLESDFLADSP